MTAISSTTNAIAADSFAALAWLIICACVITGFAWLIVWLVGAVTAGAVVLAFWQAAAAVGLLMIVGASLRK